MITIIHGSDISASRTYFISLKSASDASNTFDGANFSLSDILQSFEGGSLFEETKTIYIENFFSKRKPGKEVDEIIAYINKNPNSGSFYFWEGKELTKKQLSFIPNATQKIFSFPQTLFSFLDSLAPGNYKSTIQLFHKALENNETELIFFMMVRQFRLYLAVYEKSSTDNIDEAKRMQPWQKTKLQKLSLSFSKSHLKSLFKNLYTIDVAQKTGASPYTLTQAIDIFLLSL